MSLSLDVPFPYRIWIIRIIFNFFYLLFDWSCFYSNKMRELVYLPTIWMLVFILKSRLLHHLSEIPVFFYLLEKTSLSLTAFTWLKNSDYPTGSKSFHAFAKGINVNEHNQNSKLICQFQFPCWWPLHHSYKIIELISFAEDLWKLFHKQIAFLILAISEWHSWQVSFDAGINA